jgi:hypothetical protein
MARKLFRPSNPKGDSFTPAEWQAYWSALTDREKQSLRDKASWEHMTLAAVASEWGAEAECPSPT